MGNGEETYGTENKKQIQKHTLKTRALRAITALGLISLILCFTLTGCDPGHYYFKREELNGIVSVELINYDNPGQKRFFSWVPDRTSDLKPFDSAKAGVLESLDESRIDNFADILCGQLILYKYFAYDSPNGVCIRLTYADGGFLIIWGDYEHDSYYGYIGKFLQNGEVGEFIGSFCSAGSFKLLVNGYFATRI